MARLLRKQHTLIVATLCLFAGCRNAGSPANTPAPLATSAIKFTDVTQAAGITWTRNNGAFGKRWMPETMGGGGAFLDYDNDGWLDILLVNGDQWEGHALAGARPTLALYHNDKNGHFTDASEAMGLKVSLQGMGCAVGDYDNDGWNDLYITAVFGNRLFHNEQGKRFKEVTAAAGVADKGWSTSAAWLDYDNDGKLDLLVGHYLQWSPQTDIFCGTVEKAYCNPEVYKGEPLSLFHNEGGGRFSNVTQKAGISSPNTKALGILPFDFDGDGKIDVFVANDMEPNFAFRNNGDGTFTDRASEWGISTDDEGRARSGMGVDIADYRNNGVFALAIGNFNFQGMGFYEKTPTPPYADVAKRAHIFEPSYPYITFGVCFSDLDNDGFPDLFLTNGHILDNISKTNPQQTYAQPPLLFRNKGDGTFMETAQAAGISAPLVGRGACRGDFDNDGKEDLLLIPNTGAPRLLRNETTGTYNWLTIELVGSKGNRNGFGAQVTVTAGGTSHTAVCKSGGSYLSESDPRLHFGLGSATAIEAISVRWSNGTQEKISPASPNQVVRIIEGTKQVKPIAK